MVSKSAVEELTERTEAAVVLSPNEGFRGASPDELRAMQAAGAVVSEMQRLAKKTGHNIVGEVLRGEGTFAEWNHYPDGDIHDPESHAQYYYHAHPPEGRPMREHGRFHLFLRERGMPDGVRPAPNQLLPEGENGILCHLIAISMDTYGAPIRLFTTNRWVTGDIWYPAGDAIRMLDAFRIEVVRPNLAVNRWITGMVGLFRPQIVALLHARDRALEAWRSEHPGDAFEDRGLEVTSMMVVSVEDQLGRIARILGTHRDAPSAT